MKVCGRQFVENPVKKVIGPETIALAEKLLSEKISLAGIAGVSEISESRLRKYVDKKYENKYPDKNIATFLLRQN